MKACKTSKTIIKGLQIHVYIQIYNLVLISSLLLKPQVWCNG